MSCVKVSLRSAPRRVLCCPMAVVFPHPCRISSVCGTVAWWGCVPKGCPSVLVEVFEDCAHRSDSGA